MIRKTLGIICLLLGLIWIGLVMYYFLGNIVGFNWEEVMNQYNF